MVDSYPLVYLKGSELERQLSMGIIEDKYSYDEKRCRALIVKNYFYRNPLRILVIFLWILKNNPKWFISMSKQIIFIFEVAGFGNKK